MEPGGGGRAGRRPGRPGVSHHPSPAVPADRPDLRRAHRHRAHRRDHRPGLPGPSQRAGAVGQTVKLQTIGLTKEFETAAGPLTVLDRVDIGVDAGELVTLVGASGGMKQRTAIARALANEPEVLLLDEPFGALDAQTRGQMQEMLLATWRATGTTILLVTHDVEEAVFLSQRIYVLSSHPGRVMEEVAVPFGDDRTPGLLRDPSFHALTDDLRDLLRRHAAVAIRTS